MSKETALYYQALIQGLGSVIPILSHSKNDPDRKHATMAGVTLCGPQIIE